MRTQRLFEDDGRATTFLIGQWRAKGPLQPFMPRAVLVKDGRATVYFAAVWGAAFPTRKPMPGDQIADKAGIGTNRFWAVFA